MNVISFKLTHEQLVMAFMFIVTLATYHITKCVVPTPPFTLPPFFLPLGPSPSLPLPPPPCPPLCTYVQATVKLSLSASAKCLQSVASFCVEVQSSSLSSQHCFYCQSSPLPLVFTAKGVPFPDIHCKRSPLPLVFTAKDVPSH